MQKEVELCDYLQRLSLTLTLTVYPSIHVVDFVCLSRTTAPAYLRFEPVNQQEECVCEASPGAVLHHVV